MKAERIAEVLRLAKRAGHVLIATADERGMPHITAAGQLESAGNSKVAVTEWFCPGTVANLQKNRSVSLVVWTKLLEKGYQLLGQLEGVEDVGVLDGYAGLREGQPPMPQIEKRLLIRIEKILEFRLGPHSDVED
jgi:hypothetical protein